MGVLTTGFNAPGVDLIAMLRPTKSTGLYVQMAGRGTRLAPGKADCLVLDFAGNVARHGPIDAVKPKRPGSRRGRGAGQGLPRLPEHPRRPRCGSAPTAATPSRRRRSRSSARPRRSRSSPPASRSGCAVDGVSYRAHEKPGGRTDAAGRLPVRARRATASGSASSTPATPGRRRSPGGASARRGMPAPRTVTEALAWSRQIAAPTEIAVRPQRPLHRDRQREVRPMHSGLCAVCRREPRGFGWFDAALQGPRPPPRPHPPPALQPRPARTSAIGDAA